MKKIIYTGVAALLIAICSLKLPAQSTTNTNINKDGETGKVKIDMTIVNDDGEVEHITKEYDLSEISEEDIMEKLRKVKGVDVDMDGEKMRVVVKKRFASEDAMRFRSDQKSEMKKVAFLGVTGYTTNSDGEGPKEVRLTKVIKDKPAYESGLRNEDILMSFDGHEIHTYDELVDAVQARKPGDVVKIRARRSGKEMLFEVTLGEQEIGAYPIRMHRFNVDNNLELIEVNIEMESLSESDKALIKKSTGVDVDEAHSLDYADLNVYPNPGKGAFSYSLKLKEGGELSVTVLDQSGKQIIKQLIKNDTGAYKGTLDLEKSPNGTYLLLFKQGDKVFTEKLIKS